MASARPVVVEALSPSTATCDLGGQAVACRRTPTLRHLVCVPRDRVAVRHLRREAASEGFRLTEIERADGALALSAVGVELRGGGPLRPGSPVRPSAAQRDEGTSRAARTASSPCGAGVLARTSSRSVRTMGRSAAITAVCTWQ